MADSTAYASSGGWAGGTPLNAGGVLSNYYQKLKTVDPNSGSLTTAQPAQATTQPSSLARVATTTPATQATSAAPTAQAATALPTIALVPTMAAAPAAVSRVATAVPAASKALTGTGVIQTTDSNTTGALGTGPGVHADIAAPKDSNLTVEQQIARMAPAAYTGPITYWKEEMIDGKRVQVLLQWDNVNQTYRAKQVNIGNSLMGGGLINGQGGPEADPNDPAFAKGRDQAIAAANDENKGNIQTYQTGVQTYKDKVAQMRAQDLLDKTNVFSLSGQLQAPNTTDIDQANQNDLARVISQYASAQGGADAAAYNYLGQGAQATQQAVNSVSHNTAYANAFNQNYKIFSDALTSQQTADANASGQKLNNDIQGVNQAVDLLTQQSSQLTDATKTKYDAALIPLQKMLQDYDLYVREYGMTGQQTIDTATAILGAAGKLAAFLV